MDGENHVSEIASTYIRIVFMYKSAQYSSFSQETLAVQNNNTKNAIMCITKGMVRITNII